MKSVDIRKEKALAQRVRALYKTAFPREEQMAWFLLRHLSRRRGAAILAWLDGDRFCGFTFTSVTEDYCFVMFFAVDEALRGQGYGSRILRALREENPGKAVVLNIEPVIPQAPNLRERENRLAFYRKNGFHETGYWIREVGGVFAVLATQPEIDPERYKKVFHALSHGFWRVRIKPKEQWTTDDL